MSEEDAAPITRRELVAHREIMQGKIDFLAQQMASFKELVGAKDEAIDLMRVAYKESLDHRLTEMNNFRKAMEDQSALNVTEEKFEGAIKNVMTELGSQASRLDVKANTNAEAITALQVYRTAQTASTTARTAIYAGVIAIVPVVITLLVLYFDHGAGAAQ